MEIKTVSSKLLIDELIRRANSAGLVESDYDKLWDFFDDFEPPNMLPSSSLEDQMKRDFLVENWDDFSSQDLDKLLKQKI